MKIVIALDKVLNVGKCRFEILYKYRGSFALEPLNRVYNEIVTRKGAVMKKVWKLNTLFLLIFFIFILSACGPKVFTRTKMEFEPYNAETTQKKTKSGITIKYHHPKSLDWSIFTHKLQKCDPETGKMYVDSYGEPVMEKESILPENAWVYELSITNNLDHVVRLNKTVFAVFDPADNRYNAQNKNKLCAMLKTGRPCPNTSQLCNQLSRIKLLTKNTELLPKRTEDFYLIFTPNNTKIPGVWKLSLYDIPVKLDDAGNPVETVSFNIRTEAERYRVKYRKEFGAKPQVIQKEELSN